jgi:hypothetical protein
LKRINIRTSEPTMAIAFPSRRLQREARTVEAMIRRYCRDHHGGGSKLCSQCEELLAYARKRLHHCPFQEHKPTCSKCPNHCYSPGKGAQIKAVMRYSGPRMLSSHPFLALLHVLDGLRKPPPRD